MAERQSYPLSNHVRDFAAFTQGMQVLAEMAPERLTASQLIFFMIAATDNIAGKDPTFTSIKAAAGDRSTNPFMRPIAFSSRLREPTTTVSAGWNSSATQTMIA